MKIFHYSKKVRFGDTDPAGIVFYPRYFEMVNEAIEDWFDAMEFSFEDMHLKHKFGVPLVHVEADFYKPSRLGETLDFHLKVSKVGDASIGLEIRVLKGGEQRFVTKAVMVYMDLQTEKSAKIPDDLRKALLKWLGSQEDEKGN